MVELTVGRGGIRTHTHKFNMDQPPNQSDVYWSVNQHSALPLRHAPHQSGSVLCTGSPTDDTVKAVVFQNYETSMKVSQVDKGDRKPVSEGCLSIKGGFVLPQEVRESQIQLGEPKEVKRW